MEKRLLLAVVLMAATILFTQMLFPPPEPPAATGPEGGDSAVAEQVAGSPSTPIPTVVPTVPAAAADTIVVASDLYRYVFSTRGAALLRAELLEYSSYRNPGSAVQLVPEGVTDFLTYRLVLGSDTVDLRGALFTATRESSGNQQTVTFRYDGENGFGVTLRYSFPEDGYLIDLDGQVQGIGGRSAVLLTQIGPGFEMHEDPQHRSEQQLQVVAGPARGGGVERLLFRQIDAPRTVDAPLAWAGFRDKYFLTAIIGGESPLSSAAIFPVPSQRVTFPTGEEVEVPAARVVTAQPIGPGGEIAFQTYIGPQDYGRLSAIGYDLEEVTPYGYRWLQPIIRPLAAAVLWVLNTLHDVLGIAYGWVLIIFGVLMRVVLWPLNAKAMRSQMKNMALQPYIQEIQEKYRNDPEKLRDAMIAFTREHNFNPLGGCLPLLIPFPVLITLFFVFQNTIAFRGAEFLWLPDLSLRDPLYILPILLVVSMFGLQLLSARVSGMEQNPQMKMMLYVMPLMMGFLFFMLPSGLNLYYVSTQFASTPQQLLIAKERRKAQEEMKKSGGKQPITPPKGGKQRKSGSKR